ncbi:MAG: hotdog fold thioesterase [Solirubrobacterales bacterium]
MQITDAADFALKNTLMETLDIEITEFTRERVVAVMPVGPKVHQPFGIMHGGVSVVLAETVASAGSYQFIDGSKQRAVGMEINANHIRSVSKGEVRAIGTPAHVGRRSIIWDIRVVDDLDRLICVSRCTMSVINIEEGMLGKDMKKEAFRDAGQ